MGLPYQQDSSIVLIQGLVVVLINYAVCCMHQYIIIWVLMFFVFSYYHLDQKQPWKTPLQRTNGMLT
jgi:hypothetical protein